jgi:hypothetical protein
MKVGLPTSYENPSGIFIFVCLWLTSIMPVFMLTDDEPTTVQTYGHENGEAIFI